MVNQPATDATCIPTHLLDPALVDRGLRRMALAVIHDALVEYEAILMRLAQHFGVATSAALNELRDVRGQLVHLEARLRTEQLERS